jgi:hypothetical protein
MRIASRPFARAGRSAQATFLMTLGVLVMGWVATGCDDKHIGRPCEVNADAGSTGATGGEVAIVSSPVLACPSRICLLPADMATATQDMDSAFCTAECSSDDDCSDGETGAKGSGKCTSGFVCMIPTTTGPFCCKKMCVCHDFVVRPSGGFTTPTACLGSGSGGPNPPTCQNVQ